MAKLDSKITIKIKFDKKMEKAFKKAGRNFAFVMKEIKKLDKRIVKLERPPLTRMPLPGRKRKYG